MIELAKYIPPSQAFEWRNDSSLNHWTRQNGLISRAHHEAWLKNIEEDPSIEMFGIWADSDLFVGVAGLTSISLIHGTAEFSLYIASDYKRNGYGKAALKELLKYGFHHRRLNIIWGETFVGNPALKMFLNLGMKEEGRLRQRYFKNGKYVDSIMVSLTREEFDQWT